ncbi:hypothetical protein CTAYLR_005803 [Chrysophaeum taylorii]|uniref:Serine aminopeptidase S33 domain-containing protein n=1 Tax=Chrysophaeum taylorii TaxID=2483200 RepID=A0AAD7XQV5_9STRA|nr:hypothetical protein CTAYLR_005803 [Chrysophaeum taylorii]
MGSRAGSGPMVVPSVVEARPPGVACVAVELPGHGSSSGCRGHVDDWAQYARAVDLSVEYAKRRFGPVVVWGSSMGGLLALDLACRSFVPVVASAPMLSLPVGPFVRGLLKAAAWVTPTTAITINPHAQPPCHGVCTLGWLASAANACADFDPRKLRGGPLLLQIASNDPLVRVDDMRDLATRAPPPSPRLEIYDEAGHEPFRLNDRRTVRGAYLRHITAFVDANLPGSR